MSASGFTEIELKYDVGIDTPVPDLHRVGPVTAVTAPETMHPSSTYFDTADLVLARNKVTLRRRTGSSDAGWHVKVPVSKDERIEFRSPLSAGGNEHRVPDDVADKVRALVRGNPLIPVAHIDTRRTVVRVHTDEGPDGAELCDDEVTATNVLDDVTSTWREWEVELVTGDRALLKKLNKFLLSHGAQPGSSASKLARALGSSAPSVGKPVPEPNAKSSAGDLIRYAIDSDVRRLHATDPTVRADEHDSVHQMRVALRRLRSVLRSYRPLLDRPTVDAVRAELKWLAEVLGVARDAEVLAERYRGLLERLDSTDIRGDVAERLVDAQRRHYALAHEQIVAELNSDRYFALLDSLDRLVTDTPLTDKAVRPAKKVASTVVRKQFRAVEDVDDDTFTEQTDVEVLHSIRKEAKKLRYAAEPASLVLGSHATRVAKAAKKLQSCLGDHHDAAVSRQNLSDESTSAHRHGEDTFTFGVLFDRERQDGLTSLADAPAAWATLRRRVR